MGRPRGGCAAAGGRGTVATDGGGLRRRYRRGGGGTQAAPALVLAEGLEVLRPCARLLLLCWPSVRVVQGSAVAMQVTGITEATGSAGAVDPGAH